MSDLSRLVGEQLRMIREARSLSQEDLAEKTGPSVSRRRISEIELGKANPTLKTLEKLMYALEIAPNELFDFQKLDGVKGIEEKKMIVDIHKHLLMERGLDEVKYIVRTARDFLDTVDAKDNKGSNKR